MSPLSSLAIGMNLFTSTLIACLNEPKTSRKIDILAQYFKTETKQNIPYAFHLLIGENFGRFCSSKLLREWCADIVQLPVWLIDESYESLGDNSETIALCFSGKPAKKNRSLHVLCKQMMAKKQAPIEQKKAWVLARWDELSCDHIFHSIKCWVGAFELVQVKKMCLKH